MNNLTEGVTLTVTTTCADCGKSITGNLTVLIVSLKEAYGPYCDACDSNTRASLPPVTIQKVKL